jgi:hypothetical protein
MAGGSNHDDDDVTRPLSVVPISIEVQIKAAKRELALREHLYPQWVSAGTMHANKARDEIAAMRAILDTLVRVHEQSGLFPPT